MLTLLSTLSRLLMYASHPFFLYYYSLYFRLIIKKSIQLNKPHKITVLSSAHFSQQELNCSIDRAIIQSLFLPESIYYENIQVQYHLTSNGIWHITIIPIPGILLNQNLYADLLIGVQNLINTLPLSLESDTYEQLLWVYHYITSHCTYSDDPKSNNPWSAFFQGKTQCYGYALLTKLLLDCLHIPNALIGGKITKDEGTTSELHAWNLVRLGLRWYHFDTCFGSTSPPPLQPKYFLCGSKALTPHYTWFTHWHLLPVSNLSYQEKVNKKKKE